MKKLYTLIALVLLSAILLAQTPQTMSYQAVIRNTDGELITSQQVGMKISILQGSSSGAAVFSETHTPSTNDHGLVSLTIGNGTNVSGDLTSIDWGNGPYFIKTETDPAGGTSYTITGTNQLLSVPYAQYATKAETVEEVMDETDPVFSASPAENISSSDISSWHNKVDQNLTLVGETWDIVWNWESGSGSTTITYLSDHTTNNGNGNTYYWYMFGDVYVHFTAMGTTYIGYMANDNQIIGTMTSASMHESGDFEITYSKKQTQQPDQLNKVNQDGNTIDLKP